MTQRQLNRLVSQATGESRRTIGRLGFSVADPWFVEHDPEPAQANAGDGDADANESDQPLYVDWDQVQASRRVALV